MVLDTYVCGYAYISVFSFLLQDYLRCFTGATILVELHLVTGDFGICDDRLVVYKVVHYTH